jgi:hypothetical protein
MASSFDNVPVTSATKRGDGLYDIQRCFTETRCSRDNKQCSKCEICRKDVAYRIAKRGISSTSVSSYPADKEGTYAYVPVEVATTDLAKSLVKASGASCLEVDPCQGPFSGVCCSSSSSSTSSSSSSSSSSTNNNNTSSSKPVPWWVWLIVGLGSFFILLIFVLIILVATSPSAGSGTALASPSVPAS